MKNGLFWVVIRVSIAIFVAVGCGNAKKDTTVSDAPQATESVDVDTDSDLDPRDGEPPPPPPEGREVLVFRDGKREVLRESQLDPEEGLVIIDLSNYWVPFLFSERDSEDEVPKPNHYRSIFRKQANDWPYVSPTMAEAKRLYDKQRKRTLNNKIAQLRAQGVSQDDIEERLGLKDEEKPQGNEQCEGFSEDEEFACSGAGESQHYLEVYGIPPSLSVLKRRAATELEKPCYDEIDYDRIRAFNGFVAYRTNERATADARRGRSFARKMRREMERLQVTDPETLFAHPKNEMSKKLIEEGIRYEALVAAQQQLLCEDLYSERGKNDHTVGGLDWETHGALVRFERKNRIFGWGFFGKDTLDALVKPRKARFYDTFIRVLQERIVDSLAIIEDGSARKPNGTPATYKDENGEIHPVPNLVTEFSAIALREMDLKSPDKVVAFLESMEDERLDTLLVAVKLPDLPPYYDGNMALHATIDRGDVWYEYPYTEEFKRKGQPRRRLPKTTLYVKWNGQSIPLMTTNTTIGSWRTELAPDGYEYFKYKNSEVGPRVWKKILAGPVWMPPESTPIGDLIKRVNYRHHLFEVPNYNEFGPHYASAYGLVAAFHERQIENSDGSFRYIDNGIRSHGSVDYNSILRRYSHGCHRLYNHMAIRLFNFIIHHKPFKRIGQIPAGFERTIENKNGDVFTIKMDTRGYEYQLIDPMPIVVREGTIRGTQKTPVNGFMPKPNQDYGADAEYLPDGYAHLMESDTDTDTAAVSTDSTIDSSRETIDTSDTASAAPTSSPALSEE